MTMSFNKNQIRSIVTVVVIFAVYNVLSFVLPFKHTGIFWIGYSFGLVSLIVSLMIFALAFGKDGTAKSRFYGFPIARIGVLYSAAQVPLSFLAVALAGMAGIPLWPFVLVFILILGAAVLGTVATDATRDEIVRQDIKLAKDVSVIRALRSLGNSLVAQCADDEAKKELKKLSDMLNYCDPVSNDATVAAETELKAVMEELQRAMVDNDDTSVVPLCKKAEAILAERNRLCKLNK